MRQKSCVLQILKRCVVQKLDPGCAAELSYH